MNDLLSVLAVAVLPAAGNIVGSLLAESLRAPPWIIGAALHGAAGVAIAVVSIDLMPRILPVIPTWLLISMFLGGSVFSAALARAFRYWTSSRSGLSGAWMVYLAVAVDLLTDGLMVGAGSAVSGGLGLLLGLSQVIANIPGGFAAIGNFRNRQVPRKRRLGISGSFILPPIFGAAIGYLLLRDASTQVEHAALAFLVGVLLLATVEDMLPQADEPGVARWISTPSFAGGFALFAALSAYVD
jgi:ZIP family zinc transporter